MGRETTTFQNTASTNTVSPSCIELGVGSEHFWGWQLADEPSLTSLKALGEWNAAIAAARPDALRFYNLLPLSEIDEFPTFRAYESYLEMFIAAVKPQVLSMDFYTVFGSGSAGPWPGQPPPGPPSPPGATCPSDSVGANGACRESKEMYKVNLAILRRQGAANSIPWWNFFNAMPFDSKHADPSEAQLRQVNRDFCVH